MDLPVGSSRLACGVALLVPGVVPELPAACPLVGFGLLSVVAVPAVAPLGHLEYVDDVLFRV